MRGPELSSQESHLKSLTRRLRTNTVLTDSEIEAIEALPMQVRSLPRYQDIVSEGERPTHSCALLRGWAFRYRVFQDGSRQIMSFHVPGEVPDLHSLHLGTMDCALATMTACEVAYIPHASLQDLTLRNPRIMAALWRDTLIDAGIFRQWMASIGRRPALGRLAHLFCEIYLRLEAIGLARDHRFSWPVTQIDLADATGMTPVHANRKIRELRDRKLITLREGTLAILDWTALVALANFDPTYLHLRPRGPA